MTKQEYERPNIQIVKFDADDIVTMISCSSTGGDIDGGAEG